MLIDIELKEFGNSIGLQNLQLNEQGCLKFMLENNRSIYIEKSNDWVFFFILNTYDLEPLPYQLYVKALSMPVQEPYSPYPIQAIAKTDHDIGFFTKIRDQECDQPTIYKLFKFLIKRSETLDNLT